MDNSTSSGLFRSQALTHQKDRLAGDVIIAQPISFSTITFFLVALIIIGSVFLWFGEYSRKEVVRGYLVPSKGLLKTFAPRMGKVAAVHVREGQMVQKGQALVTLVTEQSLEDGLDAGAGRLTQVNRQIISLQQQAEQLAELHQQQLLELTHSRELYNEELTELDRQAAALQIRNDIYQQQLTDMQVVYDAGHITKKDYLQQKHQVLAATQELQQVKAAIVKERLNLKRVEHQLTKSPFEYRHEQLEIEQQIAALKQHALTEKLGQKLVVRATMDGTVTAIQVKEGEYLVAASPLLTILPAESQLQAELWVPTRAVGFVQQGQFARLRFDAFPHQRFGSVDSKLTLVSKSIINPNEVKVPIRLQEPVYKVVAEVSKQSLLAYGNELPLQAGMLLEADIVLDTRNLLEWLLDPLYSLQGRL